MAPKRRNSYRRRAVAVDRMEDESREFVISGGSCSIGACGEEAACKQFENNTYTCVCPHDSLPPTIRGTCPRKIVPVDPGRIPNVQPPSNKQLTIFNTTYPTVQQSTAEIQPANIMPFVIAAFSTFVVVVVFAVFLKRKRSSRHLEESSASPVNLKQSLLVAERYAPNPQYSACSAMGIPILKAENLKFLKEVGEGCFGKVYKGELLDTSNLDEPEIVAIKVLKETATPEAEDDFVREVEIMSAFQHKNILKLVGMVPRDGTTGPMMVFEYMTHGDLAQVLRSQKRPLAENDERAITLKPKDLLSIALQIAKGMEYLAAQRFVHRDLACRNCLVADGLVVKIADFGLSRDIYTCDYYRIGGSRLLPVRWMPLESVLYGRFTLESDIWSYGIVLWEIYSYGRQPYYGHTNEQVVKLILDGIMLIPPDDCPSAICELMKNCWKTEPRDRIRFPSICDKLLIAAENECEEERQKRARLPRPPPLHLIDSGDDLLDAQGYLLAREVKEPRQYLETLPD